MLEGAYKECLVYEKEASLLEAKESRLADWIKEKEKLAVSAVRKAIKRMAEIKFGVIVGQVWFEEFATIDENTLMMNFDGGEMECKAELKSVEIKI